jgi:hypothetical protein
MYSFVIYGKLVMNNELVMTWKRNVVTCGKIKYSLRENYGKSEPLDANGVLSSHMACSRADKHFTFHEPATIKRKLSSEESKRNYSTRIKKKKSYKILKTSVQKIM